MAVSRMRHRSWLVGHALLGATDLVLLWRRRALRRPGPPHLDCSQTQGPGAEGLGTRHPRILCGCVHDSVLARTHESRGFDRTVVHNPLRLHLHAHWPGECGSDCHAMGRDQAFPLPSFSARALKFASSPGSDCSASAFSMKPGTSDDSFRSIMYVASVVPGCAPGLSVQAPSLPFIISPLTIVHDSFVGLSAVCLSV